MLVHFRNTEKARAVHACHGGIQLSGDPLFSTGRVSLCTDDPRSKRVSRNEEIPLVNEKWESHRDIHRCDML
jgi:hypothetical protein